MSGKERIRLDTLRRVERGELTVVAAAAVMGLSLRQARRAWKRRECRACFGGLVQMDGGHHDWFGGRCGRCVLMVMIDDATRRTYARFYPAENLEAAFDVFGRWAVKHGLPRALYVDRHAIYRDEDHPDRPTQFGREGGFASLAMQELGVELILAHSPQAKGRVENRNGTFQRRLIPEMRLRGIDSMEQANAFLENQYLDEANGQFAVCPRLDQDMHRPTGAEVVLAEALCQQQQRTVGQDWCVRWHNRWLQIDRRHEGMNLPRRRVLVRQLADGQLILEYKGQRLKHKELAAKPKGGKPRKLIVNNKPYKPSARQRPPLIGKAARAANRSAA